MKALFIILPIIGLISTAIWFYCVLPNIKETKYKEVEYEQEDWNGGIVKKSRIEEYEVVVKRKVISLIFSIITFGCSLLMLIIVPGSIHQINAGEVAVVKIWGDAKEIRTPGMHFDFWLSHKYETYDTKVQQTIETTQSYSSDAQTMDVELVIQYKIQEQNIIEIAKVYGGLEMLENRIGTVAVEKTKSVLSQKSAMTIIETRATVSPDVEESIRNAITGDYYVDITTVVLTDISFSDAFEKTVEDKMIAEQEKLKAEYEKEKAIIQAEQELEVAKKQAEAQLEKAKKQAESEIELAKGEAEALEIVKKTWESLTPEIREVLLKEMAIEKWNGILPETMVGDDFIKELMGYIK